MTAPTAGWYDDPDDTSIRRWWDGRDWTDQTRPRAGQIAAGWYADPRDTEHQRWWDGTGWSDTTRPAALATAPPPSTRPDAAPAPVVAAAAGQTVAAGVVAAAATAPAPETEPVPTIPPTATAPSTPLAAPACAEAMAKAVPSPPAPLPVAPTPPSIAAVPDVASVAVPEPVPETGGRSTRAGADDAARRSRRRRILLVATGVVAVVVAGLLGGRSWLAHQRLQDPASTAAEKEWALAGASLGATLGGRGVKDGQVETVCAGAYELLAASILPAELQGVAPDRARALYLASCEQARR